jgi:peptidyl-prolyl cis-trans isomerase A (cyclophilin A)
MNSRFLHFITLGVVFLAACGGGGGNSDTGTDTGTNASTDTPSGQTSPAINPPASMSVRLLADNQVRLQLIGTGTPARPVCIRQDAVTPSASDPCFSDPQALTLEQTQNITTPSDTQRKTFTAWLLKADNTVTRHAVLSVPGRTCSTAAYAFLAAAQTQQPAVCVLTGAVTGGVTNLYESVLLLEPIKAPISANNFLSYVNQGFYDQTVFHRFLRSGANVVQGGGFSHNGSNYIAKTPTLAAIALESTISSGLSNTAGTIAMARTSEPDSATAGFFVNTTANLGFDSTNVRNGYAVFGRFIYGASSWGDLLDSVPAGNEVINPTSTVRLHWAYQIQ